MIKIIACITSDGGLGFKGDLIVKVKEDLQRFKELTSEHVVVMGRKTWTSLPKKPLPNRRNIVLTKSPSEFEEAENVNNIDEILQMGEKEDIYIIGGAEIYEMFIEHAHVLELTEVDGVYKADTYFPVFNTEDYKVTFLQDIEEGKYTGVFKTYEKIN